MAVTITFPNKSTLTIDATITQGHRRSAEVTKHPVEQGADVTDNIRPLPRELTLNGIIARAPIPDTRSHQNKDSIAAAVLSDETIPKPDSGRVRSALAQIEAAMDGKQVLQIQTGLKTYSNMVIQHLEIQREAANGWDLPFTMELIEVRFAVSATTTVPKDAIGKGATVKKTQQQASVRKAKGLHNPMATTAAQAKKVATVATAAKPKSLLKAAWAFVTGGH